MRKQCFIFIVALSATACLYAEGIDTLHNAQRARFFNALIDGDKGRAIHLAYLPIKDYTASSIYFLHTGGSLRQGQEGASVRHIGLDTHGLRRHKKTTYYGKLNFYKEFVSDLAWNLSYQGIEDGIMPDPHYFAVSKPADWDNQHYQIQAGLIAPVTRGISVNLDFGFKLFDKHRTGYDPRPKVSFNQLQGKLLLDIKLAAGTNFYLGGGHGYFDVTNSKGFSNPDGQRPANYQTYLKWMAGYGTLVNPSNGETERHNKGQTMTVGLMRRQDKYYLLGGLYWDQSKTGTYKGKNTSLTKDDHPVYADFNIRKISSELLYNRFCAPYQQWRLRLCTAHKNGDNYLYSKKGRNYEHSITKIDLRAATVKHRSKAIAIDAGLGMKYLLARQIDALSRTSIRMGSLTGTVYAGKEFQLANRLLGVLVEMEYKQNTGSRLRNGNEAYLKNVKETDYTGLSLNDFYTDVVYRDYRLLSQNNIGLNIQLYLQMAKTKGFSTTIKLNQDYQSNSGLDRSRWTTALSVVLGY